MDAGAALQKLELAILRGDEPRGPVPELTSPVSVPRTASPAEDAADHVPATRHQRTASAGPAPAGGGRLLPAPRPGPRLPPVPDFTGRARETADLTAHLGRGGRRDVRADAPVVAVVCGGPGMGKTALALHAARLVAERYPAGGVLLRLTRPDGTSRPTDEAAAELRSALPSGAVRDRCLVVLDDVVHPDQVRGLLDVVGRGAVVVTSRTGLAALVATHGPAVHRLGALPPRESEALLTTVLGRERVAAEPEAAGNLADMCGHVPLALRIVAARLLTRPKLRLADHAAWLRRDPPARLALPDDPRMSVTMTFDEALDRLPAPLVDAHLRLARLTGRITAPAAAAALSVSEARAEEVLERLLDTGLLHEEQPGTLRMNALFRAHALHRATRAGDPPRPFITPPRGALAAGAT